MELRTVHKRNYGYIWYIILFSWFGLNIFMLTKIYNFFGRNLFVRLHVHCTCTITSKWKITHHCHYNMNRFSLFSFFSPQHSRRPPHLGSLELNLGRTLALCSQWAKPRPDALLYAMMHAKQSMEACMSLRSFRIGRATPLCSLI